eukprot:scaffold86425_cov21-Tisochrysis_lutea.AAC.1
MGAAITCRAPWPGGGTSGWCSLELHWQQPECSQRHELISRQVGSSSEMVKAHGSNPEASLRIRHRV